MNAHLMAVLARFIASEAGRARELALWLLINGHLDKDVKEFMRMVRDECEQDLMELQKGTDLTAFEEVATVAWNNWNDPGQT